MVAHLLADNIGILSRKRDSYVDRSLIPPDADLSRWADLVAFLNHQNELWVQATRRISPPLLCELVRLTGIAVIAYFQTLNLTAIGEPVSWSGPQPAPVWLDVAREYTERWLHQQQIRDALDQPGLKDHRHFAPVLETFMHALPHTLRDTVVPPGTCVQVLITGNAGGSGLRSVLMPNGCLPEELSKRQTPPSRLIRRVPGAYLPKASPKKKPCSEWS